MFAIVRRLEKLLVQNQQKKPFLHHYIDFVWHNLVTLRQVRGGNKDFRNKYRKKKHLLQFKLTGTLGSEP